MLRVFFLFFVFGSFLGYSTSYASEACRNPIKWKPAFHASTGWLMDKLIRHVRGDEGGGLKEFNPACRYVLAKMATAEVERQLRVQKVNRKYPPDEYFDTEMTCQQRRETEGTVKTLWIKHKAKLTLKEACPHEWKLDEQYRQLKDAALVAMKDATEGDSSLANKSIKAKGCKLIDDQYEIYPLYDCRLDCASSDWCTETRGAVTVNPDGSETGVDERVAEIVVEQTTSVEEGDLTAAVTACNKKGPEIVAMGTFDFCSGETLEIMADHYGCTDPNQSNSVIGQMGYFNGSDLDAETKEMYHYVKKFMLDKAWKNTPLQIRSIVLNNRKCNGIIGDDPLLNSSRVPDPYEMSLEDFEHEIEFIPYLEEICTSSPKEPFPFSEPGRKEFFKYLRAQDPHLERKMKARMCCLSMNYQNAEDMQLAAQGAFVMAAAYIPGAVCGVISKNPKCELITRAVGIAGDLYLAWKPYIDEKARYEQIARGVRLGQDPEEVLDAHQILIDQKITMGKFGSILTVAFNIVPILGPKLGDIFRRFGSKNFRLLAKLDEIMTKTRVSPIQKMIEMIRSLKGDSGFMAQLRLDPTVPNGALDEILDKFLREDGKLAFEEGADALVSSLDRLEGKVAPGVLDDIKKFFKGEGSDAPGAPRVAASSVDVPVVDGLAPSSSVARPASIDIPDSPASSGASGPRTTSVDSEPSSRTSRSSASSTAPEVADARSKLPVSKKTGDRVWIDPDTTDVGRIQIIEEDILGRELSPDQRSAILRAHEEPDLRVKVKILKEEAGITDVGERAALIRSNATGDSTVPGQSVEVFGSGRRSGAASDSELVSVREKARAIETRSPPRSDVGLEIQDTYKQGDLITITNSNGSTSTVEYLGVGNKSGSDAVIVREAGQTKPHLVHADQMSARKADTAESFIHTKVDEQQFGTVATSPDSPAPVREKYSGPGGEGRPMVGDEGYQKAQRWSKQDLEEEIARGGPRSDMARDELARREKIPGFDNPSEEPLSAEALAGREQLEADALARRQEAERVRVGQEPPSALDRQTLEERVALGGEDGRLAQQELDRMSRPDGLDNPSERPLSDETLAGREQLDADALARRQEAERVRVGQESPSALDRQTLEERVALGGEDGRLAQQELDRMSRPDGLDNPSEQPLSDEALAGREQLDADALARRQEAERVQIGRDAKKDPSAIEADTLEEQLARERAAAAEAAEFDAPEAQAARVEEGRIHRPVDDKTSDDMLIRKVDEDHHTAAEAQVELDRRRKVREADARASVEREARDEAERAVASKRARVDEVDDAISDVELRMQELKTQEERLLRGQFEGDNPQQAYDDIQRERGELAERRGSLLEEQHELGQ